MTSSALDEWLGLAIARCQRLAGDIAIADYEDTRRRVEALAASLGTPPTRAHNLALAPLLLDTAFRIVEHLHRRFPADTRCPCREVDPPTVRAFLNWQSHSAIEAFSTWRVRFFSAFERHHPHTAADRLARLIREQPDRPWTVASLARAAGVQTRGLARRFRREYGMSLRAYQHLCRMHAMLDRWSPDAKIEAVALEVGYRSRKDFYRVLRQTLQTTPALLRQLPHDERLKRQQQLRARLLSRAT
jgi:AraC-like DNA-binding protein